MLTAVVKDNFLSCFASMAKTRNQQQPRGKKKKGLLSPVMGSVNHRNVHIFGHGYMYRSINSAEGIHLEPQDQHHQR
jgi:hypothetical protein